MTAPAAIQVWPDDNFGPVVSQVIGYGVGGILLLCLFAYACLSIIRYARDARLAKAAFDPDAELSEGHAIIAGVVQLAAEKPGAVKVEIEQEASETENSGNWSHVWKEIDRRVHVAPFYLQRAQGERIRIQPTNRVFLVDDMDGCVHYNRLRRTRIVELVPDEKVIAKGVLRRDFDPEGVPGGYRDSPVGWILDPPRRKRMHLSTEGLEDRFIRWRNFHLTAAALLLIAFGAAQAFLATYHYRVFDGETSTAVIVKKRHYITVSDGDETHHWEATARTPWGERHTDDLEQSSWNKVVKGSVVYIRHSDRSYVQFGHRSTLFGINGVFVIVLVMTAIGLYITWVYRKRPWYSGKVTDRGSGRINKVTGLDDPL